VDGKGVGERRSTSFTALGTCRAGEIGRRKNSDLYCRQARVPPDLSFQHLADALDFSQQDPGLRTASAGGVLARATGQGASSFIQAASA
jgi:hypothetical protein